MELESQGADSKQMCEDHSKSLVFLDEPPSFSAQVTYFKYEVHVSKGFLIAPSFSSAMPLGFGSPFVGVMFAFHVVVNLRCTYLYTYIYMYILTHIHAYLQPLSTHVCIFAYIYTHVCLYVCAYVRTYVCT